MLLFLALTQLAGFVGFLVLVRSSHLSAQDAHIALPLFGPSRALALK